MAAARSEAPKFSKLDKLNTNNFVTWREDIVSELRLHNLDHYLSYIPVPDSEARRQVFSTEVKYVKSLIRKSVELESDAYPGNWQGGGGTSQHFLQRLLKNQFSYL